MSHGSAGTGLTLSSGFLPPERAEVPGLSGPRSSGCREAFGVGGVRGWGAGPCGRWGVWGGVGLARRARDPCSTQAGALGGELAGRRGWRGGRRGPVWQTGARRFAGGAFGGGGAVVTNRMPAERSASVAWRPRAAASATFARRRGWQPSGSPTNATLRVPWRLSRRNQYDVRPRRSARTWRPTRTAQRRNHAGQRGASGYAGSTASGYAGSTASRLRGQRGVPPRRQRTPRPDQPRGDRPSRPRRPGGSDRTTSIALVAIRNRRVSGTLPRRSGRWRRRHPCTAGTKFRR